MSQETIARRYATALADVVLKSNETERVKTELASWSTLLEANADLHAVFGNPTIALDSKGKVLDQLIARSKPSHTTANFLKVLLQNGRLTDLAQIYERFVAELEQRSGVVSAYITSARELPHDERTEFEKNLEKITGKQVNINFEVDQEIIGGVVTRIGSTVYDGSVKTKLATLKEQLVNG